jgi:hypothetical protein
VASIAIQGGRGDADYSPDDARPEEQPMSLLNYIVFGLTAWTILSIVVGLGLGAIMKQCAAADGMAPATASEPLPALRKSA